MPLYHSIGRTLVSRGEMEEQRPNFKSFREGRLEAMNFRSGSVRHEDIVSTTLSTPQRPQQEPRPFQPIGVGKPLTIWIATVYPGDLPPKDGFWGKSRGALVTSAVKSWQAFDMQPRALNILKKKAEKGVSIAGPAATEEGTPLVFYSPAVVDRSLVTTFEIAFDDVDEDFAKGVADVFASAAGLPVFASAAPYLLAASALFKIGGAVANRIFDSRAEFQATENIYLDVAGQTDTPAGFALVTRSELDDRTLEEFFVENTGELINKETGRPYDGDVPCVVMALDGRPDPSLQEFSATAASAAVLQRFYNIREKGETDASTLIEALKFFNDFRYREDALELQDQIADASEEEKAELQKRYEALVKNIQTDLFKPSE